MKWNTLSLVFLLALLWGAVGLYGLTPEDEATLPTLSREKLIEIILISEKARMDLKQIDKEREADSQQREENLIKRENFLNLKEISLNERETDLIEDESYMKLQRSLLAESYRLQKEANSQNFWTGITYGVAGGTLLGGITSFILK